MITVEKDETAASSGLEDVKADERVTSQSTFATFVRRSDGSYEVKVLKQKVQVLEVLMDCSLAQFE